MIKKDTRKTLREHYRDMSADNMTADKSRKAAARTEPGTRWESLTGPHARLSICPEEIPAERIRTRWKALRASGRQRAHTDPERGNVLIINIIGTCPDICRQICHALRDGTGALISGQPNGSGRAGRR